MERLRALNAQLQPNKVGKYVELIDNKPHIKTKLDYFNKHGWGFKDTYFTVAWNPDRVKLEGNRYPIAGEFLPFFKDWAKQYADLTV